MAQRDWRAIVDSWEASRPGRMNVRLLVHLAMRMDAVDEQAITGEVLREKRQAYEDELTAQAVKVGCRDRQGIMDETTLKSAHEQSVTEGTGIVNTYNYDLAMAINTIHDQIPTANRATYVKYLQEWHSARSQWKDPQISLHNRMEWRAKAVDDFTRMNNIEGYAVLVPAHPASCDICKRLAGKRMRIQDAQRFIQEWPPHLNCIHSWEIKPLGDLRCEDLWVGKEPAGFRIKEASMIILDDKGSAKSGNYGHAGRPGKVGGSMPRTSAATLVPIIGAAPGTSVGWAVEPGGVSMIKGPIADRAWIEKHVKIECAKPIDARSLLSTLEEAQLPQRYFKGLKRITTDVPKGYTSGPEQPFRMITSPDKKIGGVYDFESNTVHIAPFCVDSVVAVSHEMGHHVMNQQRQEPYRAMRDRLTWGQRDLPADLATIGLRKYSIKDGHELFSDSLLVALYGSPEQQAGLRAFLKMDLEKLFKEWMANGTLH